MKRFASLFLVVVLVFALVGCGKNKKQIIELTLSTEDSEAIMAAAGIMLPRRYGDYRRQHHRQVVLVVGFLPQLQGR